MGVMFVSIVGMVVVMMVGMLLFVGVVRMRVAVRMVVHVLGFFLPVYPYRDVRAADAAFAHLLPA